MGGSIQDSLRRQQLQEQQDLLMAARDQGALRVASLGGVLDQIPNEQERIAVSQAIGSADPAAAQFGFQQLREAVPTAQQTADLRAAQALEAQRIQQALNLSQDRAEAVSRSKRELLEFTIDTEADLRDEFTSDPVVRKAQGALISYDQLTRALLQDDFVALQSAVVAIAQIQEPGLSVREDDRLAYTGNNPLVEEVAMLVNKWRSGEKLPPALVQRLVDLGTQLASTQAKAFVRIRENYRRIAEGIPTIRPSMALDATSIDPVLLERLLAVP